MHININVKLDYDPLTKTTGFYAKTVESTYIDSAWAHGQWQAIEKVWNRCKEHGFDSMSWERVHKWKD